jgi:hypothetical protein
MMRRLGIVAAHIGAWCVALVSVALFAMIWPPLGPGVDISVSDTSFVVLHGHFTLLPFFLAAAITFVAWRCRSVNLPIRLSWLTLGLHLVAALLLLRFLRRAAVSSAGDAVTILFPPNQALGYTYLWSALATIALCLAGSALSLVRSVRVPVVPSA